MSNITEEYDSYMEKIKAINPMALEAEAICRETLGFYMVKFLLSDITSSFVYNIFSITVRVITIFQLLL